MARHQKLFPKEIAFRWWEKFKLNLNHCVVKKIKD